MSQAKTNPNYLSDDASSTIISDITNMELGFKSISFQFVWGAGVDGVVDFYASIFPDPFNWESLISCERVSFNTADSPTGSEIVSLPGVWLNAGFIKFEFEPLPGSNGILSVASRVVPI